MRKAPGPAAGGVWWRRARRQRPRNAHASPGRSERGRRRKDARECACCGSHVTTVRLGPHLMGSFPSACALPGPSTPARCAGRCVKSARACSDGGEGTTHRGQETGFGAISRPGVVWATGGAVKPTAFPGVRVTPGSAAGRRRKEAVPNVHRPRHDFQGSAGGHGTRADTDPNRAATQRGPRGEGRPRGAQRCPSGLIA